jgi:glycosyltransferase involved in cell wall biosynthesis
MMNGKRITVVLPAYNAALTLGMTVDGLDRDIIDDLLLVDDASDDDTVEVAQSMGVATIRHQKNRGYGGNQKTCYETALSHGADIVVMLHPDYQYSPQLVVPLAAMIAYGEYDMALGSRILAQNAVERGMPRYKFVANRVLTLIENYLLGMKLSEYHTGLRAYSKELLNLIPLEHNSDDFVFDNQLIVQALQAGARIGEISCPTRYSAESSSINFRRSVKYGIGVLHTSLQYRLQRMNARSYPFLSTGAFNRESQRGT